VGKHGENFLRSFGRKVPWKIFGSVLESGFGSKNYELYKLHDEYDVMKFIKIYMLRWAGHVMRMEESDPAKEVKIEEADES
jgi:hypothetical protein